MCLCCDAHDLIFFPSFYVNQACHFLELNFKFSLIQQYKESLFWIEPILVSLVQELERTFVVVLYTWIYKPPLVTNWSAVTRTRTELRVLLLSF